MNSGVICLNGAAARMVQPGDKVIIIAYGMMTEEEAENFVPRVVMLDEDNKVAEIRCKENQGEIYK